jgi:two-component system phosphate regulon sensor histidine kinase PhoR
VILPGGIVIADSNADPKHMDNHGHRPEIVEAFAGRVGSSIRFSDTTREERMYVAVPLVQDEKIIAVVRTSIATEPLMRTLGTFQNKLAITAAGLGVLVFIGVFFFLQRINRPLEEMRQGAKRFAAGDLNFRLHAPNYEEIASLSDALNSMAAQLQGRIETIGRQRDEMQAVFGSMREAVIAVDASERILQLNAAASELLGIASESAVGQMLTGVMRNSELLKLLRAALEKREASEGEVVMYRHEAERNLQIHATPLRDAGGRVLGAMIVANDVTQLRKLERVRRDFVANVSHELKTPLTSIKGFVETLQDGALEQPDEAKRFLGIIARQVARLQAVLADLLSLSRIEQQAELDELRFQDNAIKPVLDAAIELCSHSAEKKNITVRSNCPDDARVRMNAALLEQAAANLIENAIKYSEPGSAIRIEAAREDTGWKIDFSDEGCGIESQHIERIFERFYRVDKARTRSEGGTGLGLSIVKHIMSAHSGSVTVQSAPGQGSTFTLHFPAS